MLPLRPDQTCPPSQPEIARDGKRLDELRRTIARLQALAVGFDAPGETPLGVPEVDQVLGGGLMRGALHEIAACGEAHVAAATGFALGVAALSSPRLSPIARDRGQAGRGEGKAVVWVAENMALIESGVPYGPGLDLFGLQPERLLTVAAAKPGDVLWAMEEALQCRAVGTVIGEIRSPREIDLVAARRLSLAAAAHGATALLLRTAPGGEASAAATRWVVEATPSPRSSCPRLSRTSTSFLGSGTKDMDGRDIGERSDAVLRTAMPDHDAMGAPRFNLTLTRNRRGPPGSWMLEWSVSDVSFVLATHPQPVARAPLDRSDRARAA